MGQAYWCVNGRRRKTDGRLLFSQYGYIVIPAHQQLASLASFDAGYNDCPTSGMIPLRAVEVKHFPTIKPSGLWFLSATFKNDWTVTRWRTDWSSRLTSFSI